MSLKIVPGLFVISIILDKAGNVKSSIINLKDVLFALAPLETVRHLKERDILFVNTGSNAHRVTAEVLHGVLLNECSKFIVKALLLSKVGL